MDQNLLPLVLQSVFGLMAVLGLFALMVWGMRKFQGRMPQNNRDFRVIQKIHLDNRSSIVEIRHQGRHYLLAVSAGAISQLSPEHALPESTNSKHDVQTPAGAPIHE